MIATLGILFLTIYVSIMVFLHIGVHKAQQNSQKKPAVDLPPVTVIVVARNEEDKIGRCLAAIEKQQYEGRVQVIIVDDHSSDRTGQIAAAYAARNSLWQVLFQPQISLWRNRKKTAIAAAYEKGSGELFLFTDADCQPPTIWIRTMTSYFDDHTLLVAGFSPLYCIHKPFWERMLNVGVLTDALIAAGTIGWQIGVSCSGRNLAYRKGLIPSIGGYAALPDSKAGDDDAVLQAAFKIRQGQIKYSFDPAAHVPAMGPASWREFLQQKKRHLSAGKFYPWYHKLGFLFLHLSNIGLWFISLLSVFIQPIYLCFIGAKILTDWFCISSISLKLHRGVNPMAFIAWQFVFLAYHIICAPAAWMERFTWKNKK